MGSLQLDIFEGDSLQLSVGGDSLQLGLVEFCSLAVLEGDPCSWALLKRIYAAGHFVWGPLADKRCWSGFLTDEHCKWCS